MESIKQKAERPSVMRRLPDFRNLGVLLRTLLLVNFLGLLTVFVREPDPAGIATALVVMAGRLELPLLLSVLLLFMVQPWLARLAPRAGFLLIGVCVGSAVMVTYPLVGEGDGVSLWRWLGWAAVATGASLFYFDYRSQRFSPALTEARLMALTSRIRPHFLFNSLNGVLGVIRSDPRRAERALEELADLFRAQMQENRELVPIADELALCERYLDLEQLRLGERLQVRWLLDTCPRNALIPPLLLQPLLENAVYHGVEPASGPAEIVVHIERRAAEVLIKVDNPVADVERHHAGNRMALDNIRERLMLFFDLEAYLETERRNGRYRVSIRFPYRRKAA